MISKIGQMFVIGFDGFELSSDAHKLLSDHHAGGAILFKRNIESLAQVVSLNTQIVNSQVDSTFDPIISVDQEGGRVARLRDICTPIPTMRKLAELSITQPNLIYKVAALMGRELSALGFHLNFAPIADIDSNAANPIIGDRSFASDKQVVGQMCADFIFGLQDSGVAACAKHFPGHGDTSKDSHIELPILNHSLEFLRERELFPFQKAILANVATIMTAHVLLPKIDNLPATLSHKILTGVLRDSLNFEGLIISDDLEMKGIADHYSLRDILVHGINAGVDVFLVCSDTDLALEAILETKKLVESGEIQLSRVESSLKRIAQFKRKYLGKVSVPSLEYAQNIVGSKPHKQLLEALA